MSPDTISSDMVSCALTEEEEGWLRSQMPGMPPSKGVRVTLFRMHFRGRTYLAGSGGGEVTPGGETKLSPLAHVTMRALCRLVPDGPVHVIELADRTRPRVWELRAKIMRKIAVTDAPSGAIIMFIGDMADVLDGLIYPAMGFNLNDHKAVEYIGGSKSDD